MTTLSEYKMELREGLEAALRRFAMPLPSSTESVTAGRWVVRSSEAHRDEMSRTDRALCALLLGDHLSAAQYVETAGPVGAALICLRSSVLSRRSAVTDGVGGTLNIDRRSRSSIEAISRDVLIPPSDWNVWVDSFGPAEDLFRAMTQREVTLPAPPLAMVSRCLAPRSLLSRQAFATVFLARFAAVLCTSEAGRGVSSGECAKQQAALTIAYLNGGAVDLADGRLRLENDDTQTEPTE